MSGVAKEVRCNDDGSLDELVGVGHFHLEQMSATHWWMLLETEVGCVHVNLQSKATIKAYFEKEPPRSRKVPVAEALGSDKPK